MGVFGVPGVRKSRLAEDEETSSGTLDSTLMFAIRAEPGSGGHGLLDSNWTVDSVPKR